MMSRAPWPTRVTDSVATNVGCGRLRLKSSRTWSSRKRFATCAWRSHAGDTAHTSFGSANMHYCTHGGLDQLAGLPTQTTERVEKVPATLQNIERVACDQHDHVSFAKAWMLMSKGTAHAMDYNFRLVPPAVMAPLQRRLEGGLRQTLSVLLGSAVSELAKLSTCFGGLGIRVAQMGFAAQATYWSAVDLHKAVMTSMCVALDRPQRGAHLEETTALAAKADLLMAGLLLMITPGSW